MNVFLCGGGSAEQTTEVNAAFAEMLDKDKPLLYVPLAMEAEKYDECLKWITGELNPFGIFSIQMVRSGAELAACDLMKYSAVFIGGGNTYRLLAVLKTSGAFERIKEFVRKNGVVVGGSAGAIIFGKDIRCTDYADENKTGLTDTKGFDVLNGYDVCCHFGNRDEKRNRYEFDVIREYARKHNPVFALSESSHLFVENTRVTVVGPDKACLFHDKNIDELKPGSTVEQVLCL